MCYTQVKTRLYTAVYAAIPSVEQLVYTTTPNRQPIKLIHGKTVTGVLPLGGLQIPD